jgi:hypothetical protein
MINARLRLLSSISFLSLVSVLVSYMPSFVNKTFSLYSRARPYGRPLMSLDKDPGDNEINPSVMIWTIQLIKYRILDWGISTVHNEESTTIRRERGRE